MGFQIASLLLFFALLSVLAIYEYLNVPLIVKLLTVLLFLACVFAPLVFPNGIGFVAARW